MSNIIEKLKVIIEKQTIELKVSIFNLPNVDDIITNILNNKEIHLNINIKDFDFKLYFKDYVICKLKQCNDGLEFKKWR